MATLDQAIMRGLLSARPANATGTAGRLYFATDENALYRDSGTAWEVVNRPLGTTSITAAAGNHTHAHSALTGIGANDHHNQAHGLQGGDHGDVSTATPSGGQVLTFNSGTGKWEPQTASTGSSTLAADTDVSLATPANGQFLQYQTSDSKWHNHTLAAADVPTLNQNTTGTAANVTGTVAIVNGGTGQTTQQAAIDALAGTQSAGTYLRSDGTHTTLATIQAADVPALNQDTTGKSAKADALNSATTVVNVSSATAPSTGQVLMATDSTHATWQTPASGGMANPMTTQDDLIIGGAAGAATRLPKGSDSQVLTVDPTTHHLVWANIPSGFADPTSTKGDLIVHGASTTRLAVGTDTQVLTADSSTAAGIKWATPTAADTRLNPASELYEYDDFMNSGGATGGIGQLGWTASGGSTAVANAVLGHPGIIQKQTSTSSGTFSSLWLGSTGSSSRFDAGDLWDVTWIVRLNTNDANTTVQIGVSDGTTITTPADGAYFEKLDADTSWFGVTRASSSQTRTAALATVDTGWHRLRVRRVDSTHIGFSLDGGTETTATATLPASGTGISVWMVMKNSAAANKTMDIDYASLRITGLSR